MDIIQNGVMIQGGSQKFHIDSQKNTELCGHWYRSHPAKSTGTTIFERRARMMWEPPLMPHLVHDLQPSVVHNGINEGEVADPVGMQLRVTICYRYKD